MFSKGTFQRYLFEIESGRKRSLQVYEELAGQVTDSSVSEMLQGFVNDLKAEEETINRINAVINHQT